MRLLLIALFFVSGCTLLTGFIFPRCGDGIIDRGEACDDGNNLDGDDCGSDCHLELFCGNGFQNKTFLEQCDDGNQEIGDGCRPDCTKELCRDGILDPQEACDDGNLNNQDDCTNECLLPRCGDGILAAESEACDDENNISGDGCSADCSTIEFCGNGVLEENEVCEDGNHIEGDACSADCRFSGLCGNGVLDPGEACEDSNRVSGDGCRADCKGIELCGDSLLDITEECDDGNNLDGDGCQSNCLLFACAANDVLNFPCFGDQLVIASGLGPTAVAATELSPGSGIDVIASNTDSDQLSLFSDFSTQSENFTDSASLVSGEEPGSIAVADIDGDGLLEIVVANSGAQSLSLYRRQGNSFAKEFIESSLNPRALAFGSLFGAQPRDLVSANGDGIVHFYKANNSLLTEELTFTIPPTGNDLAISDFNNDGQQDVAVVGGEGTLTIILKTQVGSFAIQSTRRFGDALRAVASGDFTNDGFIDLVVADQIRNQLFILVNDGLANFTIGSLIALPGDHRPRDIVAADMNGDGAPDLVTANRDDDNISVLIQDGQGNFIARQDLFSAGPTGVAVADLNADGVPDIIAAESTSFTIHLYFTFP